MQHELVGDTVVIRFDGRLDFSDYGAIEEVLSRQAMQVERGGVVLNLSKLEAITSSGISILAKLSMDHRVKVVRPKDLVKDLLDLSGVSRILDIVDAEEQALRGLSGQS